MTLLVLGTKESSNFNIGMTIIHLLLVAFIIIAGFVKSDKANASDFVPFSVRGIFDGASYVFFSYIGFDAVATSAEEVRCNQAPTERSGRTHSNMMQAVA